MGIRRISGAPFMCIFSGILVFGMLAITDDIGLGQSSASNFTNTISPSTIDHMNVLSGTASQTLRSGSQIFIGEEIGTLSSALAGKRIDEVCIELSKTGTPTGTANIAVYSSTLAPSSTNYRFLINTLDVSSLTTTSQTYCFLSTSVYTLDGADNAIGIFYNGGSAGNEINIRSNGSDPFDGTDSRRTQYVASWSDTTGNDVKMRISLSTIEERTIVEPYDFNNNDIWVYQTFMAVFFIITGIIFQIRKWEV